MIEIKA